MSTDAERTQLLVTAARSAGTTEPIGERTAVSYLLSLGLQKKNAVAQIQADKEVFLFLFEEGKLADIQIESNQNDYTLGGLLSRAGAVTGEQLAVAQQTSTENRRPIEESFTKLQILSETAVRAALKARLTYLLQQVVELTEGSFSYVLLDKLPYQAPDISVSLARVAWDAVKEELKKLPRNDLLALQERFRSHFPFKVDPPPMNVSKLPFSKNERRFFDDILGAGRRLWQVLACSNLRPSETMVFLLFLEQAGLLEFAETDEQSLYVSEQAGWIIDRAARIDRENDFEILDIHWSSHTANVEEAFRKQKARFSRQALPSSIRKQIQPKLTKIHAAFDRAYHRLRTRQGRIECRAEFLDQQRLEVAIDILVKKGELASFRSDFRAAKDYYRRALDLESENQAARKALHKLGR